MDGQTAREAGCPASTGTGSALPTRRPGGPDKPPVGRAVGRHQQHVQPVLASTHLGVVDGEVGEQAAGQVLGVQVHHLFYVVMVVMVSRDYVLYVRLMSSMAASAGHTLQPLPEIWNPGILAGRLARIARARGAQQSGQAAPTPAHLLVKQQQLVRLLLLLAVGLQGGQQGRGKKQCNGQGRSPAQSRDPSRSRANDSEPAAKRAFRSGALFDCTWSPKLWASQCGGLSLQGRGAPTWGTG